MIAANNNRNHNKEGWKYLLLALGALAGLGTEALYAFLIEPLIYDRQIYDFTTVQIIIHWIVTSITWGIIVFALIRFAKTKACFDVFERKAKIRKHRNIHCTPSCGQFATAPPMQTAALPLVVPLFA